MKRVAIVFSTITLLIGLCFWLCSCSAQQQVEPATGRTDADLLYVSKTGDRIYRQYPETWVEDKEGNIKAIARH
jgi:hypothetical protein